LLGSLYGVPAPTAMTRDLPRRRSPRSAESPSGAIPGESVTHGACAETGEGKRLSRPTQVADVVCDLITSEGGAAGVEATHGSDATGSLRLALTSPFDVGAGPGAPPGKCLPSSWPWGHIGATLHRRITDNSGHWRSTSAAAQQLTSAGITGHPTTRVLSGREEVRPRSSRPCAGATHRVGTRPLPVPPRHGPPAPPARRGQLPATSQTPASSRTEVTSMVSRKRRPTPSHRTASSGSRPPTSIPRSGAMRVGMPALAMSSAD
jgi:hypothetical protein